MKLTLIKSRIGRLSGRSLRMTKKADPHYGSAEHRTWVQAVLRRARYECEKCGRSGKDNRLFADHIVEIVDGGAKYDVANGQALCGSCHTKKTAKERMKRMGLA